MNSPPVNVEPARANDGQHHAVLEAKLGAWWSELLGGIPVGPHHDFFQLGGRPEHSATVIQRIKTEWGVVVRSSDLYEARTISKLADLIGIRQTAHEQLCIVPIRAEGDRQPLFLVHGVGGNILGFAGLARSLYKDQPVYGIQAQALNPDAPTLIRLEAMARFYVEELRQVQPVGPYAFLGFSYGGLVAYEMAQQLVASGEQVRFLGMLDTWQPGHLKMVETAAQPRVQRMLGRLHLVRLNTKKLSLWQLAGYLSGKLKSRFLRVAFRRLNRAGAVSLPESMRQVRDINMTAAARYVVQPYPGKITLFRAEEDARFNLPEDLNWRSYAGGGVEIVRLPGDHGQILAEPNLSFMTRHLDAYLAPAQSKAAAIEEFELDDDRLVDLKPHDLLTAQAAAVPLVPVWMRESSAMPGESASVFGVRPQKVAE